MQGTTDFPGRGRRPGNPLSSARRIWIFHINRRWVRDAAVGGNVARYINHACHPNCYVEIDGRTIWLRASSGSRRAKS
jgi:SET domain-containing protein